MPVYNLPVLTNKKIVSYFNELDIDITENDLNKPSQLFVTKFYMEIMLIYTSKNYSKATENSSLMLNFIKDFSDFLSTIGLNNLSLKDIINPTNKRFGVICSFIANFSMFRDSKKNLYEKASEIADSTVIMRNKVTSKRKNIQEAISTLKGSLDEHKSKCIELQEEINGNERDLKNAKVTQKDKISELGLLKKEKMDLNDKFCGLEMIELNLKQDIKVLNGQIVTNPEALMSLVQEMRVLLENEKSNVSSLHKVINERLTGFNAANKQLDQAKSMHEITQMIVKTENDMDALDQREFCANSQMKNLESSIKNRRIRINHIDRQIAHIESKIETLGKKNKKLKEEMQQKLLHIKNEYNLLTEQKRKNDEIRKQTNVQIQKILYEKSREEGIYMKQCDELTDLLLKLKTKVEISKI